MRVILMLIAALIGAAASALADYKGRVIGAWIVSAEEDRFGDGGTYIAIAPSGGYGLAVRCIRKNLSLGLLDASSDPKPLSVGSKFELKFRVDKLPIYTADGVAISERLIQIDTDKGLVKSMKAGRETAVRIEQNGVSSVQIFKMTGAKKAFADLESECPLD